MSDDEKNAMPPPPPGLNPPPPPGLDAPPPPPGLDAPPPAPGMDGPPPPPGMDGPPPPPGMGGPPPPPGIEPPMAPPPLDSPPPLEAPEPATAPTAPPPPMDTPPAEVDSTVGPPPPPPGMEAPEATSEEPEVEEMPPPPPDLAPAEEGGDPPPPPPGVDSPSEPPTLEASAAGDLLMATPPPPPQEIQPQSNDVSDVSAATDLLSLPPAPPSEEVADDDVVEEDADDLLAAAADDLLLGTPIEVETSPEVAELATDTEKLAALVPEEAAPHQPAGAIAGAKIRSLEEVDDVKGDKIEGSIHEEEKSTLAMDGSVIEQSVKGNLTISNPSKGDRLWDIDVLLDGLDNVSIDDAAVVIPELDAGKKNKVDYTSTGPRMLILRENIDTNPERQQESSHSIVKNIASPSQLTIEVENVSNVVLSEVAVTKQLPKQFALPADEDSRYTLSGKNLTWDVGVLGVGETRELSLDITIEVDSKKPVKSGKTKAKYKANSTLSGLDFTQLDAYCRGFSYMSVSEDERPDNWQCQAIFKNRSSFVVDLVKLQVQMSGSDSMLLDVSDVPDDVLADEPGSELSEWRSEVKVVEGTERPDFTIHLGYTVLPRCQRTTAGTIELEQVELCVLDAELSKSYDSEVLRSYRPQTVSATVKLANSGSSVINLIRLVDDIPGLFSPPDEGSISVSIDGSQLDSDQIKSEFSSGVTLEESRLSPDGPGHTMKLTIGNKGPVGMEPGSELQITYLLNAPDPTPENTDVAAPVNCEFIAERYGPSCHQELREAPAIRVSHKRRKFSAGKTLIPTGGKGNYEVLIMFENSSDSPLKDVVLPDFLPAGFDLKGHRTSGESPEYPITLETKVEGEGTAIEWHIPMILCAQRIELSYDIKGEGDLKMADIQSFRGAQIGDIVDEDMPAIPPTPAADDSAQIDEEDAEPIVEDFSWNEDVLLSVIDAYGITDREAFLAHAIHYDNDENMYLKRTELEDAADNYGAETPEAETVGEVESEEVEAIVESTDDVGEEETPSDGFEERLAEITYTAGSEDPPAEAAPTEELATPAVEEEQTTACPICASALSADAATCNVCNYQFDAK